MGSEDGGDEPRVVVSNEGVEITEDGMYVIESMCPACQENGESRLLRVKIPYFRDIMVMSFQCPHCGHRNNESQSMTSIQPWGERIRLTVTNKEDLDRQVVKSEYATIRIPDLQFEIPPATQKATVSTVQGVIMQAADGLGQSMRNNTYEPDVVLKLSQVVSQLTALGTGDFASPSVVFEVDDPAGNSYIENPTAPERDPHLEFERYERTIEQTHSMGFYEEQSGTGADLPTDKRAETVPALESWNLKNPLSDDIKEAEQSHAQFVFPCPGCGKDGNQNMCLIDIPGFRQCWIMAFVCDFCGTKSNEVKPAGAIGDRARKFTLVVNHASDLSRDILKSDTAAVKVPEVELELEPGTLGGVFTTLEGVLVKIADELTERFPFVGDSQLPERKAKLTQLTDTLRKMASGEALPFTFILDDPADLSHIGRREVTKCDATDTDPNLSQEVYDRTDEQNDDLGLKHMKVEGYEDQQPETSG